MQQGSGSHICHLGSCSMSEPKTGFCSVRASWYPQFFISKGFYTDLCPTTTKKKSLQLLCNVVSIPSGRAYQSGRDPVPSLQLTFYLCYSLAQEEGEDSTSVISRRVHSALEHSELPGKQGLPEPERVWAEERLQPARPYAEED